MDFVGDPIIGDEREDRVMKAPVRHLVLGRGLLALACHDEIEV
jgi:hypothetical protein